MASGGGFFSGLLEGGLIATVHTYLPDGTRIQSNIRLQSGWELTA